tara:strand:- start:8684 stop:9256 length:573 start_codon:yes stop_codon:yes gene_type:complete
MELVFDTETNGAKKPNGTLDNSNQEIVQMSWILSYPNGKEVRKNYIISGVSHINYSVPHDITVDMCKRQGIDFSIIIDEFMTDVKNAHVVIAHNFSFDSSVIINTMRLKNIPSLFLENHFRKKRFCTMRKTSSICKLVGKTGKEKPPKLCELYYHYFGEEPNGKLHDALYDCEVTLACFKEYKKNSMIIT